MFEEAQELLLSSIISFWGQEHKNKLAPHGGGCILVLQNGWYPADSPSLRHCLKSTETFDAFKVTVTLPLEGALERTQERILMLKI